MLHILAIFLSDKLMMSVLYALDDSTEAASTQRVVEVTGN